MGMMFLSICGVVVGGYLLLLGLKNLWNAVGYGFSIRLAPGYEVSGDSSLTYVSGSREMEPYLYGNANPSRLHYHEKGLLVFTRRWTFEMWACSVVISLFACTVFCGLGGTILYYAVTYLHSFVR